MVSHHDENSWDLGSYARLTCSVVIQSSVLRACKLNKHAPIASGNTTLVLPILRQSSTRKTMHCILHETLDLVK